MRTFGRTEDLMAPSAQAEGRAAASGVEAHSSAGVRMVVRGEFSMGKGDSRATAEANQVSGSVIAGASWSRSRRAPSTCHSEGAAWRWPWMIRLQSRVAKPDEGSPVADETRTYVRWWRRPLTRQMIGFAAQWLVELEVERPAPAMAGRWSPRVELWSTREIASNSIVARRSP